MKKNSTSNSAFFNLRVLVALLVGMTGISLALFAANPLGRGTGKSAALPKKMAQLRQKYNSGIGPFILPPGFDCAQIHQKVIDRMENFGAHLIMVACGVAPEAKSTPAARFSKFVKSLLPSPLVYDDADLDLI